METKATERQQHFLALAAAHAEDFKSDAVVAPCGTMCHYC